MKLYVHPFSSSSRRVTLTAELLGVKVEPTSIDLDPDLALIARHEQMFHQTIAVLDKHLADRTWIVGSVLSLADLSLASTLMYRVPTKLPIDAYPNLLGLLACVEALAAWKSTEPARNG
ncbi:MAG: glutathione S-transferase family protein [Kofleriaceae bacterium]|nr:glutathione S-transferase family protein [Kofleriaceae bacterium]